MNSNNDKSVSVDDMIQIERDQRRRQIINIICRPSNVKGVPYSTYEIMERLPDMKPTYESWQLVGSILHKLREDRVINGKILEMGVKGNYSTWVWWQNMEHIT